MRYESSNQSGWARIPRRVRALPGDLFLVGGFLLVCNVFFYVPGLRSLSFAGAQLWIPLALALLVFVPGYVLVSILFPGRADRASTNRSGTLRDPRSVKSLDLVERAALSFGMSMAILPLFGVVVGGNWGFSPSLLMAILTALLLAGIAVAIVQRLRLPPDERFELPVRRWGGTVEESMRPTSTFDGAATLALALAVLLAAGAIGYAVATPYQSGSSSTLYLVTENETGTHLAADYPTEFTAGQPQSLTVGIENDEERRQAYTIVVIVERVRNDGSSTTVTADRELDRLSTIVPAGEHWTEEHAVAPEMTGENLRLHYALYRGTTVSDTPYRDAYLWIDVTE